MQRQMLKTYNWQHEERYRGYTTYFWMAPLSKLYLFYVFPYRVCVCFSAMFVKWNVKCHEHYKFMAIFIFVFFAIKKNDRLKLHLYSKWFSRKFPHFFCVYLTVYGPVLLITLTIRIRIILIEIQVVYKIIICMYRIGWYEREQKTKKQKTKTK